MTYGAYCPAANNTLPVPEARRVAYCAPMSHAPDNASLMLRYRDGDLGAFEELYRRHQTPLYRYLLRLSFDQDVAEDVFQETWSKIIRSRDNYQATARFRTFLFRVARNCFIDYLRRNKRHSQASGDDPDSLASTDNQPDVRAGHLLALRQLENALKTIPDEQRDVFLLHEEGGFNLEEIARITGVKRETAKSRLRYAIKKLRAAMQHESGEQDA